MAPTLPGSAHLPTNLEAVHLFLGDTVKSVQDPHVPERLAQAGLDLPLDGLPVGVPVGWRVVRVCLMGHIMSDPPIPSLFPA